MKKLLPLVLALALVVTGCASKPAAFEPEATTKALLESTAFSETLEALPIDLIAEIYGLTAAPETALAYGSTGATAENVAVFLFADEDAAKTAAAELTAHAAAQIETLQNYLPLEVPKLERASVRQQGASVLFVVANDYAAMDAALKGE